MKAVVTGSSGFVGRHLVRQLAKEGWSVTGLSNKPSPEASMKNVSERLGDIRNFETTNAIIRESKPEIVFHLAAQASVPISMREPELDVTTNVLGSVYVAQAAATAGARRIVFFSTGGALYGQPEVLPANEYTQIAPDSVYGASKIAAEYELQALCRHLNLELSILRPGNIYGPGQDATGESGVIAIFTTRMLAHESVTIFGDGKQERDYLYVDDVVRAAIRAAIGEPSTCVIGTGKSTTTQEIFETLAKLTGYKQQPIYEDERPGDIATIQLDIAHARELWGWEPLTPLTNGMAATVEWFRTQQDT